MNLIASWSIRICELRNALAEGEVTMLVPNFLSVSYLWTRGSRRGFDKRQEMRQYVLVLSAAALILFAHFATH